MAGHSIHCGMSCMPTEEEKSPDDDDGTQKKQKEKNRQLFRDNDYLFYTLTRIEGPQRLCKYCISPTEIGGINPLKAKRKIRKTPRRICARSNSRYNNKFQSLSSVIGPIVISTEITTAAAQRRRRRTSVY